MSGASDDTVPALLAEQVARRPQAPALYYGGRSVSYAELEAMSRRAAKGLEELGVGEGDSVALWLPNTPAYVALWLACARLGAIAVAVNTRFRSAEVGDIVARSGARIMALWPGFRGIDFLAILAEIEPEALARLESLIVYDEDGAEHPAPAPVVHCRQMAFRDLLAGGESVTNRARPELGINTFTTSGTTSKPKFVLHGQRGMARQARLLAGGMGWDRGGAMLLFLPLCGVFGFSMLIGSLAAGAPIVLESALEPERIVTELERYDVRHVNGPDEVYDALLKATPPGQPLGSIRIGGYGIFNASLTDIVERAEAHGLKLVGLYGMSETMGIVSRQNPAGSADERRPGGGAPICPDYQVRAGDPESGAVLPHGQQGELQIRGPSLFLGYYDNAEATRAAMTADGYLKTGDLGYTTSDSHFVFTARMGDALRLGGFLVSPAEIESHLRRHVGIDGAQVVGVMTDKGLRAVGFVTPVPGQRFDEAALIAHCLSGLARFKAPVRVFPVDEFPTTKSANGSKIQRVRLREMAQALLAEDRARSA